MVMHHEPTARWIRARKGDVTVVDTRAALVVHEPDQAVALYAVPLSDVAPGALVPAAGPHAPGAHGCATEYYDLITDAGVVPAAAWRYPSATGVPATHLGLAWAAFDRWFEEDAEVFVHPRQAHRVDALPSSRHVRVTLGDRVLADSRRPVIAFEGSRPPRFYLPPEDVDRAALVPRRDASTTGCPYKGRASCWDLAPGAGAQDGPRTIAWTYDDPLPEVAAIAGRIAFFDEHVEIVVDGQPLERPLTRWSASLRDDAPGGVHDRPGWRFEPSHRWVRGLRDDRTLVDSRRAVLVWAPGERVPVYAFPQDDVHRDALWLARRVEALEGHVTFGRFVGSGLDRWFEEDEEVFVHPRDPYVRVDALPSSRHVRIESAGVLLAETRTPVLLFETGLPPRFYLPPDDVDRERLAATTRRTSCAYKGRASYWSVLGAPELPPDVVWSYPNPPAAQALLRDRLAFYDEHVDVLVDGVLQERPAAPGPRRRCVVLSS